MHVGIIMNLAARFGHFSQCVTSTLCDTLCYNNGATVNLLIFPHQLLYLRIKIIFSFKTDNVAMEIERLKIDALTYVLIL